MGNWRRDVHHALRMLARNKGFTAIAVLALALGIGPNVAMFSIIWASFLAPSPQPEPKQLAVVWTTAKGERNPALSSDFEQYRNQSKSFQHLDFLAWGDLHAKSIDPSQPEIAGQAITAGFFSQTLRLPMAVGRDFLPGEGQPGKEHVVLISHRLWAERYHADPAILGRQITIEDEPYTVVGVTEAGTGDRATAQFTIPLVLAPGAHQVRVGNIIGRLKPGVTIAEAQAEFAVISKRLSAMHADGIPRDGWGVSVEPFKNDWFDKKLERNLWLLLGAVGFVLLIACANVANLLLAKGATRQQEMAVRSALGASRGQVFAQLLVESVTLSVLGGVIGIAMGWVLLKLVVLALPVWVVQMAEEPIELNLPVLLFAVAVTLVGAVLFGCAPAWHATRPNLSETLKLGARTGSGRGRMRTQGALVVAEFALALTLLAGAGMALHSFWKLTRIDIGARTDHVLTAYLMPVKMSANRPQHLPRPEQINANARLILEKVRAIPGVQSASLTTSVPMTGHSDLPFAIAGSPVASPAARPMADLEIVSPGHFETFGIRLVTGRFLGDQDTLTSPRVVMVNEAFVRRYLPNVDPLEARLLLSSLMMPPGQAPPSEEHRIVGVFHDVLNGQHLTDPAQPAIFAPFTQSPFPFTGLAVRTVLDPGSMTGSVRAALATVAPTLKLSNVQTMDEIVNGQLVSDRFGMALFAGFAALALLLAALGIYGVMSFAVAQRTHEIGVRMALGAQRRQVVMMMVRRGMALALAGAVAGLAGVYAIGHFLSSTLYGIHTIDVPSFAAVGAMLVAVALVGSYLPARRSAKVDPMVALRQE